MAGDEDLTANPGGMFAGQGDAENARSKDWRKGAGMGGAAAQDHADRRGRADRGMTDDDPPRATPTPRANNQGEHR